MTVSRIGPRCAMALLTAQIEVTRGDDGERTSDQHLAAQRHLVEKIREAAQHPVETIDALESLTVGLIIQLAALRSIRPGAVIEAMGLVQAAHQANRPTQRPSGDHAVPLLTVGLERMHQADAGQDQDQEHGRAAGASRLGKSTSAASLRQALLAEALRDGADITITTLVKIAVAGFYALGALCDATPEEILTRLAEYVDLDLPDA